ncbi:Gamma-aminobutyric acid type B receptor subunit like protein [Argiope bruennichi]|uniref:Gamma-aminobutyric acid type B receptor subunit like protein n=1 Tax=Argiope bruennichi TaxID=94029 RepID=A0A8T0FHK4_ARGBR|nr:Gamma-aminobutyric acid type B receptor subunit like protein [Argiope bruennichi]
MPTKLKEKRFLQDLKASKRKSIAMNFINRKFAKSFLWKTPNSYHSKLQSEYKNKFYFTRSNYFLRLIRNKTIKYGKRSLLHRRNNGYFGDGSFTSYKCVLLRAVPKLLEVFNRTNFFELVVLDKSENANLRLGPRNKETDIQHIPLISPYIDYKHGNYHKSGTDSSFSNNIKIFGEKNVDSKSYAKRYQHTNTDLPTPNRKFDYFNKDHFFRLKQPLRCSNDKRECFYKTHRDANKTDFRKSVKRSADYVYSDIEDASNANFMNETLTTVNDMADNMTMDIGTDNMTTEIVTTETDLRRIVYLHGLFEMSRGDCRDFPETGVYEYKAALLAIQHINSRDIIEGYKLQMYYNDTQCDSGVAVDAFFHSLYRQPVMTTLLGTGSSEVTERLARVVSRWNIVQVSYGAKSPALSDRKNFPMFFRTVAPDSSHSAALLSFVLYHKWFTVATLHEQGDKHSLPMTKLNTDLEQVNVTVALTKGVSERDYKDQLQEVKNQDCRIIICSFSSSLFKKIFCEVYYLGMYGADYAWIMLGDNDDSSWELDSDAECNDHQLRKAVQGVISVGSLYEVVGNGTPISEKSLPEILEEIEFEFDFKSSGYIAQTYDAVWAIALALKEVEEYWRSTNSTFTLGDFTYDNALMAHNIAKTVSNLHFMGISGPVSFHNSDRVGITAFHQRQGTNLKLVAIYTPDSSKLEFECIACSDIEWQGGSPPISSRNIILRIAILDRRVFICVTALAILGVSLALTFLSFNLYYRKIKFIKLSSPNLNNFVIVGCILVYITVILLGMDHGTLLDDNHFRIVCSARAFLLSGGFSLAFGCMFIKTYRVYHIFIRANTGIVKSKLLHDQQLLGMVSVLLLIDCILIILWVIIDPMERKLISLSMQVNKDERNVVYLNLREHCSSTHMAKWLGSLYIYKGFLLVVGCYMAWETRHVKVPALNDSQYIGMSVYNVVITSVIVVALANVIPAERYTLTFVLVSTLIFVSTTMTLCILFVPKIHTILLNPDAAAVVATPGVKVECKTRRFAIDEPRESLYRAEVLNRALKRELKELDEEYNRLAINIGLTPTPVRKPTVSDQSQDDDSDDGLPPWISEYKDYSSTGSDDVWCTSRPTIASAFSAIHQVALQIPSTSTSHPNEIVCKVQHMPGQLKDISCSPLRASLTTIGNLDALSAMSSKPVRNFLSDRTLNELKNPQTSTKTQFTVSSSLLYHPVEKQLRSEPKLFCDELKQDDTNKPIYSAKSLNQISLEESSQSDCNWTTAPLNESTSFSTPLEDFISSSNNGISSIKSTTKSLENNTISNYLSCEDTSTSTQESSDFQSNHRYGNPSHSKNPENSTFCELSLSRSCTSAVSSSSSSSMCGATVSDSSARTSDSRKDFNVPASDADTPLTEYSSNPTELTFSEVQASSTLMQRNSDDHENSNTDGNKCAIDAVSLNTNNPSGEIVPQLENRSIKGCDKRNGVLPLSDTDNSANSSSSVYSDNNALSSENNNFAEQPLAAANTEQLREQIFRLKRELILSQLDQSESVDL